LFESFPFVLQNERRMSELTTRIGLVDDNLDNFHANTYLALIRGALRERGFEVAGATAREREAGEAWAREHNVRYFGSVAEMGSEVDCFAILAPSTPECHWELCEQTLPHGKATFVDKTFAPDEATAVRIFQLADRFGAPIQTTSALRTSNIQRRLAAMTEPLESLLITASGPTFAEYGIHPVELAVSCLGHEATELACLGSAQHPQLVLRYTNERTCVIDFVEGSDAPFGVTLVTRSGSEHLEVDFSTLFAEAAGAILDFFAADQPLVDRRQTLLVRRILDRAADRARPGVFQSLLDPVPQTLEGPHWSRNIASAPGSAAEAQHHL
jgi:predicted dehydrogenase